MDATISNWWGGVILARELTHPQFDLHLACHVTDPVTDPVPSSTEVPGAGYERQVIRFGSPNGKTVVSINAQRFDAMPVCVIGYLALWFGGGMGPATRVMVAWKLPSPLHVVLNQTVAIHAGDLALSL